MFLVIETNIQREIEYIHSLKHIKSVSISLLMHAFNYSLMKSQILPNGVFWEFLSFK